MLEDVFDKDRPQIDKYKVVEGVKNFGIVGKQLYNNNNIVEPSDMGSYDENNYLRLNQESKEFESLEHHHILGEQDDWFDKVSINKNMKSLKGSVVEFQKTVKLN